MLIVNQMLSPKGAISTKRVLSIILFTIVTGIVATGGCSKKESSPNGPSGPTPLAVTSVTPSDNSAGINVNTVVTATFSRELDASSATPASFYINGVTGTVSASGSTATLTPSSALAEATSYTVTITASIKDVNGVALADVHTSNFTTGVVALADAGPDRDASRGETVVLSGSSSAGGSLTYLWEQVAGTSVGTLSGQSPVFAAPDTVGTLVFTLRVDDGSGPSAPDTVTVWVLEDRMNAYWVSPYGADSNDGTRTEPMLTIQAAVNASAAALKGGDVYIASGSYDGSIALALNVSLYGGFHPGTWLRDVGANPSIINGGAVAISGVEAHNVTLDGLRIYAGDATDIGASSVAVSFARSKGIVIAHNLITAGNGAIGANGTQPGKPAKGSTGGTGDDAGDCIPANEGGGGVGDAGRKGGNGGNGGAAGGFDGGGGEGPCGGGGNGGFADAGDPGGAGCTGANGDSASVSGAPFGTIVEGVYMPAYGKNGSKAADGGGGGGGGGGAGSVFGCGGGGGGGGEGGVAGGGGTAGQGGGASIGIILSDSTEATVVDNIITTATGGAAGYAGLGGSGGDGGNGGAGGGSSIAGWSGGKGGNGGAGGTGGIGSGGGGGPTVGIAEQGSTSFQDRITFNVGNPGPGGVRPDIKGTPGQTGEKAEVKKLP